MITEKEKAALDLASWLGYERREGFKEGEARGRALERQDILLQTARNLLAQGISPKIIQEATGLPSQQIKQLR